MTNSTRKTTLALAASAAIIVAACSDSMSTAPNVLNLRPGIPSGWSIVGTNSPTYALGVDNNTRHGGGAALAIAGTDSSRLRFSGIGQFIRADNYRGKRVRLSAWVRQSSIVGTNSVGLWMRIDGPGLMLGFDNFSTRPLLGTTDWHQVEIILDVPNSAIGIAFGALMSASGELFVDDMIFEIIPATGPTTNQLAEPTVSTDSATEAQFYGPRSPTPTNLDFEKK